MTLTIQEREALERGDLVPFTLPNTQIECVVVRRDLLDPIMANADYSPCPPDELLRVTAECVDEAESRLEHRRNPTSIIGVWKMDPPPTDAEVERILEDELLRKYG